MALIDELIGSSPRIVALRRQIQLLLTRTANRHRLPPVLITGEAGTGKSLLARIIHRAGSRSTAEFVEVNAAIPEHLLESMLFGAERGTFPDAGPSKPGLFQGAHRGTLFLDQVGRLPLSVQARLLQVLEDDHAGRLGSTPGEPVDVCVMSATNEDLGSLVQAGRFRKDLYHRLAVVKLELPPLRERGDDLDLLAAQALARACAQYSGPPKQLSPAAQAALRAYRWPGNVSELNTLIERVVLVCPTAVIPAAALGLDAPPVLRAADAPAAADLDTAEFERQRLSNALARTGWNISRTAAFLRVTRNTVRARIARFGLRGSGSARPGSADADMRHDAGTETLPGAVGTSQGRPSIAVLPFRVEGEDKGTSYFGDGIVEDIVGALAALGELLVISRSSTLRYRGAGVDARVVGREVGVSYVLSGSVRRAGPSLRVSVELTETTGGAVGWAGHFEGVADGLFALQDQITTKVVTTIAPHVREIELRRALRKRPDSLAAYDCVLRAQAQIYQLNHDDFAEARTWLEKAIVLDPAYAIPYALLATWHAIRVCQGWSPDTAAAQEEVLRLATAALARDSFDAMALALCGHAKSILRYEFDEALRLFDRAIEASPSSAIAWTRSGPTYAYIGNAREAIRRVEHGLRLSPLDPHIFIAHTSLGLAHYVAGEHDEATRWGRKAREENPRYTANLRLLAANLAAAGRTDEAREVGQALLVIEPAFIVSRFVERYAIRDPDRQARLARHLRLAGLPG